MVAKTPQQGPDLYQLTQARGRQEIAVKGEGYRHRELIHKRTQEREGGYRKIRTTAGANND